MPLPLLGSAGGAVFNFHALSVRP